MSVVNVEVKSYPGERVESLIKRFKKKVSKEKILDDILSNMYHEKKSVSRRKKRNKSIYYQKKEERKRQKCQESK